MTTTIVISDTGLMQSVRDHYDEVWLDTGFLMSGDKK